MAGLKKFLSVCVSVTIACSLMLAGCSTRSGRDGKGNSASNNGGDNYTEDFSDAQSVVNTITHVWGGDAYLDIKENAYQKALAYYNSGELAHGGSGSLSYAAGTTLRMACGYDDIQTGITVSAMTVTNQNGAYRLADGEEYTTGKLKPTWAEISRRLGITFKDEFTGKGSARAEFSYWSEQLSKVDMVSGNAESLQEAGSQGKLVNIADYLDMMPNFKAFLDKNPIVRMSITGSVDGSTKGAIYFSPYFDGVNDIDRMPLMRVDYLEKLLNGSDEFTLNTRTDSGKKQDSVYYTPYMPLSGKVTVDVVKADGSGVEQITKDYSKYGNIIEKMNQAAQSGTLDGETSVRMLREYIDKTYDGYYGENRADLFEGQNAAWDADELVALLRCVVLNPKLLNKTSEIQGIFTREENNNQRRVDMLKLTGVLFGVRGLDSRQEYFYFDKEGKMHDARQELDTYAALERMNALVQEKLISSDYVRQGTTDSEKYLGSDLGFMSYDYNQTQTIYNDVGTLDSANGEKYMAVMVPVARWKDGTNDGGTYMRFTESWRSVKSDGWAISKSGIGGDNNKLYAALKLIDYAYSDAGIILMSYGPDDFIKVKDEFRGLDVQVGDVYNGKVVSIEDKYVCFNFNGTMMPEITNEAYDELKDKAKGNYTNYARRFLGSTLSFMKSQAFEYQCTSAVGKEGVSKLSVAIAYGTIKHPLLSVNAENMWYTSVPTTFPLTARDNTDLAKYSKLSADGKFSQSKDQTNSLVNLICGGYANFNKGSV